MFIFNVVGKKIGDGVFVERGSLENGHTDVKHCFGVRDLKDNSIKWLGRSEFRKKPRTNFDLSKENKYAKNSLLPRKSRI